MIKETVKCNFRIKADPVREVTMISGKTYQVVIDYPLDAPVSFPVEVPGTGMTTMQLIDQIREIYRKIYKTPAKFRVWGHGIDDLWVEEIHINHEKGLINLRMGS